jgi:DNA processing protein
MDTTRAYLRFHLAEGIGSVLMGRLMDAFGDAVAAAEAGPAAWKRVEGIGPKLIANLQAVTEETIDAELAEAQARGARVMTELDEDYPQPLRHVEGRPRVLYVRGRIEPADAVSVGVVGARRCTHYGIEQARRFGELLGRAGFTVVSGGARGIDTSAHRGVLAACGRTLAVMGCGLSTVYPPENAELFEHILDQDRGALISELPMKTAVLAGNFPTRNRIISGLSLGVLVVEAARRSGALITAREALEQGREVFAVPGRVDSPMSQGTNAMIRAGSADLVQNLDDILERLGEVGRAMSPEQPSAPAAGIALDDVEQRLVDALVGGELGLDELVRRSGLPSPQVVASMTVLVLKGAVVQRPGNVFALKAPGRS